MQNYSLLLTYNKDTKILDLLNNETKNEKIYTAKEVEKISIDEPFEITDRLDQRIKDTVRFDDFPLLGYFYKKEGEDYISIAIENKMLTLVERFSSLEDCIEHLRGERWEEWELEY